MKFYHETVTMHGRCSLLAVITEQQPVEPLELVLPQRVVVLVDGTFFHALPFLDARSSLALHAFHRKDIVQHFLW